MDATNTGGDLMDIFSELKRAQLEVTSSDKTLNSAKKALIWFNSTADKIKAIFNSDIKTIATEDWVTNEATTRSQEEIVDTFDSEVIMTEKGSTPATPAANQVIAFQTNQGLYSKDDAGAVKEISPFESITQGAFSHSFPAYNTSQVRVFTATDHCIVVMNDADTTGSFSILGESTFYINTTKIGLGAAVPRTSFYLAPGHYINAYVQGNIGAATMTLQYSVFNIKNAL